MLWELEDCKLFDAVEMEALARSYQDHSLLLEVELHAIKKSSTSTFRVIDLVDMDVDCGQ